MPTFVVIEVDGTGKDKQASEDLAVSIIKKHATSHDVPGNIEVCTVMKVETPRPFERMIRVSKGGA
jgi:hypothetical protein